MPKADQRPHVQVLVLHDATTGRKMGVSAMWLTTFTETDQGTEFKFTNGETVIAEEDFEAVSQAFVAG